MLEKCIRKSREINIHSRYCSLLQNQPAGLQNKALRLDPACYLDDISFLNSERMVHKDVSQLLLPLINHNWSVLGGFISVMVFALCKVATGSALHVFSKERHLFHRGNSLRSARFSLLGLANMTAVLSEPGISQ